jgi:hypothetical protein
VTARRDGREVKAGIAARFWEAHVASGGASCARCVGRFFDKLFGALAAAPSRLNGGR